MQMIHFRRLKRTLFPSMIQVLFILFLSLALGHAGDDNLTTYQSPPQVLVDIVDAPPTPSISIDPTQQWMLVLHQASLPGIDELAQDELRLAGLRINPKKHSPSRESTFIGIKLIDMKNGEEFPIAGLPDKINLGTVRWSPDGQYFSFLAKTDETQSLWLGNVASKLARPVLYKNVSSVYGTAYTWLSDNKTLICKVFPDGQALPPAKTQVPTGPVVQETSGKKAPAPTFQDLLKNRDDEALFEYHLQAQLVKITVNGNATPMGPQGLVRRFSPSPNGQYLLVETIHRPFSYLVPVENFPHRVEIWDAAGNLVKQLADLPLAEEIPLGFSAVPTGPRDFDWRSDAPASIYWVEAQDGGDPKIKADIRDKVYSLDAPFNETPFELISLPLRYGGIYWGNDRFALIYENWWETRKVRGWRFVPNTVNSNPELLFDFSYEDRYHHPGFPLQQSNAQGQSVLVMDTKGQKIYLVGDGASPEGDRPFLDEFNLATQTKKRLFRSEAPFYERTVQILDGNRLQILTRREAVQEPPNFFIRDLKKNKLAPLTHFRHPTPQLQDVTKELIRYKRSDGVDLNATLYLPPGYQKSDDPLPLLMWAYPQEFKSADAAGQVTDSPYRFVRVPPTSPLMWLALGYAVLDDPSMPIIGEGDKEPNDTYVEQLVASARAAADKVVDLGVTAPGKIAIAGHSYGAFMAANLLAHSDLFATGIARSGAYNRTLTPFGFQAEERTLWQAPEVYMRMSPFMYADNINEPLLLIHGEADNNSGTFPMQSERFYNAIKGHGGTARLVFLPLESHGYRARESILHMLWEMMTWLEKYLR